MSQSIAEELARVPMSPNLMATLTRATDYARQQGHGRVTLEHMLLALTEDSDAALVLQASQVATEPLNADVTTHLASLEPSGIDGQTAVDPELKRVLEAAAAAAEQGRRQVNGAIVLAAIVGEGKSTAAQMLRAQGLTFEHAIKALQRSARPQTAKPAPAAPAAPPRPAAPPVAAVSPAPQPPAPRATPPPLTPPPVPPPAHAQVAPPLPEYETQTTNAERNEQRMVPDWAPAALDMGAVTEPATTIPPMPPRTPRPPDLPVTARLQPQQPPVSDPVAPIAPAMARPPVTEPSWQPAPSPREEPVSQQPSRSQLRGLPPELSPSSRIPEPAYDPVAADSYHQQSHETHYASQPSYGHEPSHQAATAEVPWQPPEPAYAQHPGNSYAADQGYPPGSDDAADVYAPDPHRGPPLPALVDTHREGPPAASGQLIENIPRTMHVDTPVTIEVRLVGTSEAGHDHFAQATRAMSVRLSASDGGYTVESLTPETQWIDGGPLPEGQAVARWRWMVVPLRSGRCNLQLAVSTRWISADGISSDMPMPAQQVTVSVRRRYGKSLGRLLGWIVAAGVGGALALFGGGLWTLLLALLKPWIGG